MRSTTMTAISIPPPLRLRAQEFHRALLTPQKLAARQTARAFRVIAGLVAVVISIAIINATNVILRVDPEQFQHVGVPIR